MVERMQITIAKKKDEEDEKLPVTENKTGWLSADERRMRDESMELIHIPVEKIKDNPYQPRESYSETKIKKLGGNISKHGLINPITVVSVNHGSSYILLSGHRRLRAFKKLGRKTIPATIRKSVGKGDLALILAIEHALRKDFTVIEKSRAIFNALNTSIVNIKGNHLNALIVINQLRLFEKRGKIGNNFISTLGFEEMDVTRCENVLVSLAISPNTAISYLRLLDLPTDIQNKIVYSNNDMSDETKRDGVISVKMGYELTRIKDEKLRLALYKKICEEGLRYINTKYVVDKLLELGEDGFSNIGRNRKRDEEDYGISWLTDKNFHHASRLWNWRQHKLPLSNLMTLDNASFQSSLTRLRKSALYLVDAIDRVLKKTDEDRMVQLINKQLKVTVRPGTGGQKYRFTFPDKFGKDLLLREGDDLYLQIVSIKHNNK
jgi:ParB-like chromosome segregation protein Spo0J